MLYINGLDRNGELREVLLAPPGTAILEPGFDVTPARLVTSRYRTRRLPGQQAGLYACSRNAGQHLESVRPFLPHGGWNFASVTDKDTENARHSRQNR